MIKYYKRKDGFLTTKININGKQYSVYAKTPTNLKNKAIELRKKVENNEYNLNRNQDTFESWSNTWLDLYKKDKAYRTYKDYKDTLRLINRVIGSIKIEKLSQLDILSLLSIYNDRKPTRKKILLTIKQVLEKAVENEFINKNIAAKIKLSNYSPKEKKPLNKEQILKIYELSKTNEDCYMILFMIYTGLRREEIIPLQFKDIDWKNNIININKAIYYEKNQPKIKDTKNHRPRDVPLLEILKDGLKRKQKNSLQDNLVFGKDNRMMSTTMYRHLISRVNKLVGFKFTGHQLRHTYACILHKAKIPLKEAQTFMGHKDLRVLLQIYTTLDDEDRLEALKLLNLSTAVTTLKNTLKLP